MMNFKVYYDSMIPRPEPIRQIKASFQIHPITALLGPRQCGKTTLAQLLAEQEPSTIFDLENPIDIQRLSAPMQALKDLSGLVIIDEVQRKPELFELLRVLVDRPNQNTRFLLLGSASPQLVKGVSESLAGRIGFVDLAGFQLWEVEVKHRDRLWIRGGLPRAFLADSESDSIQWREGFIRTFLERDIPQLGITIAAETLRRFWTMVAHYHGQVWNAAEFARSLGTAENTARRYLDILAGAYMVRILPPWFENLKNVRSKRPRYISVTVVCFTACCRFQTWPTCRDIPKSVPHGRVLRWSTSSVFFEPETPISGQHTRVRNLILWRLSPGNGMALNLSTKMLLNEDGRCI